MQEEREQQQMPGENSEINNYDTGAGFFQVFSCMLILCVSKFVYFIFVGYLVWLNN